jgi:hypothetical protein
MTATKTVEGYFGPKQITREEYVKQWTSHFSQMYHLIDSSEDIKELDAMKEKLSKMAGVKWDRIK